MYAYPFDLDINDSIQDYIKWCKKEAMRSSLEARNQGERIHKAIEDVYKGEDCLEEYVPHVGEVQRVITELFGDRTWHAEETFASHLGYGGMCDLHSTLAGGWSNDVVLDFKTKDFTSSDKPPKGYPEQKMQLEACAFGLGLDDALIGNIFISRTEAGLVHVEMYDKEDYLEQFKLLLELWKRRNKYLT